MSTRLTVDLLFLALAGAVASWFAHAPETPPERAAYICAPVVAVTRFATQLEGAMADDGSTLAPIPPWRIDPSRLCTRLVIRLNQTPAS